MRDDPSRRDFFRWSATALSALAIGAGGASLTPRRVFAEGGRAVEIIKGPFVQLVEGGAMRLRFETREATALEVVLIAPGGGETARSPTLSTSELRFKWPQKKVRKRPPKYPDLAGEHTVQDARFEGLAAGETYRWAVRGAKGPAVEGAFKAPPARGEAFRLGWLADTRRLIERETVGVLEKLAPDLVIHGGDLQYQSDERDTWRGFFQAMGPLFQRAPVHFCVGNHEHEGYKSLEFDEQFMRLFEGQGDGVTAYHSMRYGGALFVVLNTEDEALAKGGGAQHAWLVKTLEAATASAEIDVIIPAFHRPLYSFSKRQPPKGLRETLHPLFVTHRVPLVLTGHNHCYERFGVDGITYITDGGGGASLYDPDMRLRTITRESPELIPLREVASKSHGVTVVDVEPGRLVLERFGLDGESIDRHEIAL